MDTFNSDAFTRLKKAEQRHFWFSVRNHYILDMIRRFSKPPARMLEIGCGTGYVSSFLASMGYDVTGCEYFPLAFKIAYGNFTKVRGNAFFLPFKEKSFNIIGLFDVIEHFDDDKVVLTEAKRVLKRGGILVITVPAKEELWSYLDVKAHHKRRYSSGNVISLFSDTGLRLLSIKYMFSLLYIPMKLRNKNAIIDNQFNINPVLNKLLKIAFETERVSSRILPMPVGTSLIAACVNE